MQHDAIQRLLLDHSFSVHQKKHYPPIRNRDGSYYYFTSCPICSFCQREGIGELMGPLCETDKLMFEMQHGVLHRKYTIAKGDPICDYWIVGDKVTDPK